MAVTAERKTASRVRRTRRGLSLLLLQTTEGRRRRRWRMEEMGYPDSHDSYKSRLWAIETEVAKCSIVRIVILFRVNRK